MFVILTLPFTIYSQGWLPLSAQSNALANATVTQSNIWSFHHNPGATPFVTENGVGVSYQNRFLLRELQAQGLTFVQKLKVGTISAGAQFYGYNQFRTNRLGIGYALKLTKLFSVGLQLNYLNLRFNESYGNKNTLTAELGLLAQINSKFKLGFAIFNLNRSKLIAYQDDRFTTLFRLGCAYDLSNKVTFLLELSKDIENPLSLKTGVEYKVVKNVILRFGAKNAAIEISGGLSYKVKSLELALATKYHQTLGFSPSFNLNYYLSKAR